MDGAFRRDGNADYLLSWVWGRTRWAVESYWPWLTVLRQAVEWHYGALSTVQSRGRRDATPFQEIVIENHRDIAVSLYSAQVLIGCGSLADVLTVLRPAVEFMLDVQYLKRWPRHVSSYQDKALEYDRRLEEVGRVWQPRDPRLQLRFRSIGTIIKNLVEQDDYSPSEEWLVYQWNLFSNVAEHASPDRKHLNARSSEAWKNAILQFHNTVQLACHQLRTIDEDLADIIERDESLSADFQALWRKFNLPWSEIIDGQRP